MANIKKEEEEEAKEEVAVPAEATAVPSHCQICNIMILNKDMVGDMMPEGRYLQLTATARSDGSNHTFFFCDKCRFNELLINSVSLEYQKILSNMDYKVIQGVHN